MECWARFWDIHTRSPANIIKDEKIVIPDDIDDLLETQGGSINAYTDIAYDYLILNGKDSKHYAEPYRWALEIAHRNSRIVQCLFPIITYYAFATDDPISFYIGAFEIAIQNRELISLINSLSTNINLDWLKIWQDVYYKVIYQMLFRSGKTKFTSGFDVIKTGELHDHPIFSEYNERLQEIRGKLLTMLQFKKENTINKNSSADEETLLLSMPLHDFSVIFALSGQPFYRYLLGTHLPPPQVIFTNFTCISRRPISLRIREMMVDFNRGVATYEDYIKNLDKRVRRFRNAELASSLGLPVDSI